MQALGATILIGPELIHMKFNHHLKYCEFDSTVWLLWKTILRPELVEKLCSFHERMSSDKQFKMSVTICDSEEQVRRFRKIQMKLHGNRLTPSTFLMHSIRMCLANVPESKP